MVDLNHLEGDILQTRTHIKPQLVVRLGMVTRGSTRDWTFGVTCRGVESIAAHVPLWS